ncbi:MAG: penicillin acylase family protein, partial [Geminicoccaceae bacterium]
ISDLNPAAAAVAGADRALALAWTQLQDEDRDTTLASGFALARSGDARSFVAAAELYRGAQQNMAFATRDGTIGMISPGAVPIRRSGDGRRPVPGWTGEYDWVGTIPATELPRSVDPPGGLLINANNRLVGPDYPHLLATRWEPPYRAERIAALLAGAGPFDIDRFAAVQLDRLSGLAVEFRPFLPRPETVAPDHRPALAALAAWDGIASQDRPEPILFAAWYRELGAAVAGGVLGPAWAEFRDKAGFLARVLTRGTGWCGLGDPPQNQTCVGTAAAAFDRAMADLAQRYGADWRAWRWGEAHPALLAHRPFEQVPALRGWFSRLVTVGGDATSVNVASPTAAARPELPFAAFHAAGYRALYDLARPDRSRWIVSTGQSGHLLSPHYVDQAAWWAEGRYLTMSMEQRDFLPDALGTLALEPVAAQ